MSTGISIIGKRMRAVLVDAGKESLKPVVEHLISGKIVAIPTETVYGLAANALDEAACEKIFEAKGRPKDNPLIVHISSLEQLYNINLGIVRFKQNPSGNKLNEPDIPEKLMPVLKAFWPGPLTVLLPKGSRIPDAVSAGLDTVGVRCPLHPIAHQIISECGFPLAAPSANLSGRPSPTTAQHVLTDLADRIEYVVDGGACEHGLESTVLDATRDPPLILRPGSITLPMLKEYLPTVRHFSNQSVTEAEHSAILERPSTPGMKYRHYSPHAPLYLISGKDREVREGQFECLLKSLQCENVRIVKLSSGRDLVPVEFWERFTFLKGHNLDITQCTIGGKNYHEINLSLDGSLFEIGHNLYGALRAADLFEPTAILTEALIDNEINGEGDHEITAIMNRLEKAASHIFKD